MYEIGIIKGDWREHMNLMELHADHAKRELDKALETDEEWRRREHIRGCVVHLEDIERIAGELRRMTREICELD